MRRSLAVLASALLSACATIPDHTDLLVGGAPALRTVHDFDKARHLATFKVYTHVLGLHGEGPITKGETTGLYPHHRGCFVGWNRVTCAGKTWDFWHGKDGVAFRVTRIADRGASQTFTIEWLDPGGAAVVIEERTLSVSELRPRARWIEITSELRAAGAPVALNGDPHHAGCHFRAAQEVAEREKETVIVTPASARRVKADDASILRDALWTAELFTIAGHPYVVAHFAAPTNPRPTLYSVRGYGRLGAFCTAELTRERALVLRYALLVADRGEHPDLGEAGVLDRLALPPPR